VSLNATAELDSSVEKPALSNYFYLIYIIFRFVLPTICASRERPLKDYIPQAGI
jgi:hypothetical protein